MLATRGGDFELHLGQDISIGYLSHAEAAVRLYLQETFTFLPLTAEAAVALAPRGKGNSRISGQEIATERGFFNLFR